MDYYYYYYWYVLKAMQSDARLIYKEYSTKKNQRECGTKFGYQKCWELVSQNPGQHLSILCASLENHGKWCQFQRRRRRP